MSYPPASSSSSSSSHHQPWAGHRTASTSSFAGFDPPQIRYAYASDANHCPDPHSSPSSLASPSSFGNFGVRRARSSGALPTLHSTGACDPSLHSRPAFPPSPVSPDYPPGLGRGPSSSAASAQYRPTPALAGWRGPAHEEPAKDAWVAEPSSYARQASFGQPPQTPPPSARFKRTTSAQPVLATPEMTPASSSSRRGSTYSSGQGSSWLGVPEAAPMTYSRTTATANQGFQHSSPEQISQFLNEMSEILGPDALAALSPKPSYPPPRSFDARPPPPTVNLQRPPPAKKQAKYNVNGVLLDEDDYRAFASSPASSSRQESLAHAPGPSVGYGDRAYGASSYGGSAYHAAPYDPWGGYLAPSQVDIQRPASAPPTPVLDTDSATHFAPYGSTYESPIMRSTAAMNRRRGSSFDASSIPRTYSSGLVGLAPFSEDAYGGFNAGLGFGESVQPSDPQQLRRTPPSSAYPPSFRVGPSGYGPQYPAPSPTPSPARRTEAPQPQPQPQPEPTTPQRRPKPKGAISFLNFSAADSQKLLNGVAPSGSSKKRARDEEQASPSAKRAGKRGAV